MGETVTKETIVCMINERMTATAETLQKIPYSPKEMQLLEAMNVIMEMGQLLFDVQKKIEEM